MIKLNNRRVLQPTRQLTGVFWNVNVLTGMGQYIHEIVNKAEPDVILLTETKRRQTVDVSIDLA